MHNQEPFLDPNKMATDGTANIGNVSSFQRRNLAGHETSKGGSDWSEIHIKTPGPEKKSGKIEWVKFSGISWEGNGFIIRYDAPDSANILKGKNEFIKSIITRLVQNNVWTNLCTWIKNMLWEITAQVLPKMKCICSSAKVKLHPAIAWMIKTQNKSAEWKTVVADFENEYSVVDNDSNIIYMLTNKGASNYKLVKFDAENPSTAWQDVIPESSDVLGRSGGRI